MCNLFYQTHKAFHRRDSKKERARIFNQDAISLERNALFYDRSAARLDRTADIGALSVFLDWVSSIAALCLVSLAEVFFFYIFRWEELSFMQTL
ncbi:hypothetical protein CEXT_349021 [Caerostris extrusa]|uniref:Uncharacterized protein n=1 Tax=Caerostris extrusa TaxID=172846 RepID=A0AAV4QGX5_CAEEX|nr:hypothetical protein CEXT_349021 [Caerostris extrusa]